MKTFASRSLPWIITVVALYYAFQGIDFNALKYSMLNADPYFLVLSMLFTCGSYAFRARRWQYLFLKPLLQFADSYRVLILGFFMNNILPARTGELIRAHVGSKVSGETRTLVLASIASERLLDGVMISFLFITFAAQVGDQGLSQNLTYVAIAFALATFGVAVVLFLREHLFALADRVQNRFQTKIVDYTRNRFEVFIHGLSPLFTFSKAPVLILWTFVIWFTEVCVYLYVSKAYGVTLPFSSCVLFLVAVNFSSLIPAAPGGLGVIEAITTAVLVSTGINKETALAMVLSQHLIQYIVVGIPGIIVMLSMQTSIRDAREASA